MENILKTSFVILKEENDYFISNINYIESSKEELFEILNNGKYVLRQIKEPLLLDELKLEIIDMAIIEEIDDVESIEWLNNYQKKTILPIIEDKNNYKVLNLKIKNIKERNKLKKIFLNSEFIEEINISDVYRNILNVQNNDYFDFVENLFLCIDNFEITNEELVDFNKKENKNKYKIMMKVISKINPSTYVEDTGLLVKENNHPSIIFYLQKEK